MKAVTVILLVLAAASNADLNPAYGYLAKYGVPEAQRIKAAEEALAKTQGSRIVGGTQAALGQYPYQVNGALAGLLIDIRDFGGQAVCGAVLVSDQRLLTAAHCWFDGQHQGWRVTVTLGSITLFSGGTRVQTSAVMTHPRWFPLLARNDIAAIYLASSVATSANIAPIALPHGSELEENFAGDRATVTGYGLTSDDGSITPVQSLSHASLQVISNRLCSFGFPFIIQGSHVCTSGIGGAGACRGDSGGPLVATRNNTPVLIGIASFVHVNGCQSGMPAAFTRVTSFMDFINHHIGLKVVS